MASFLPLPSDFLHEVGRITVHREALHESMRLFICWIGSKTFSAGEIITSRMTFAETLDIARSLSALLLAHNPAQSDIQKALAAAEQANREANGVIHALWKGKGDYGRFRRKRDHKQGLQLTITATTVLDLRRIAEDLWIADVDLWGAIGPILINASKA